MKEKKKLGETEKAARKNVLLDLSKQLEASIRSDLKKPKSPKPEQEAMEEGKEADEMASGDYNPESEPEFSTEEDIDAQINKLLEAKSKMKKSQE